MGARFSDLRMKVAPVLRPYARRISVFGSFARGEATEQSDINLLVALKPAGKRPPLGLFGVIWLKKELEQKLGRWSRMKELALALRQASNVKRLCFMKDQIKNLLEER